MIRRKIIVYGSVILLVIVLVTVVVELFNPLRRSAEQITEDILELTPIGSSMEDVIRVIESKKSWEWSGEVYPFGFLKQPPPPEERTEVGVQSIDVFLGDYRNIFVTSVTVFWAFDENSVLIDVWVWKDTDTI
ncbi:MAG: hypothetical protein IJN63_10855 [Clostridia bacterium]|nr:hypothetical protein [Clostridia bacterium]